MKTYIKALKKSINQERFLIRVAGLEYEVAQKLPQAAPIQENCGPGWERDGGRCGKTVVELPEIPDGYRFRSIHKHFQEPMSVFLKSNILCRCGYFLSQMLTRVLLPR